MPCCGRESGRCDSNLILRHKPMQTKRPFKWLSLTLLFTVITVFAYFSFWPAESGAGIDQSWNDLRRILPPMKLTDTKSESWFVTDVRPGLDQFGHCDLKNGDVWTFAFRSHHNVQGTESLALFRGPKGTFRLKGGYFCCEIMPPFSQPDNSDQFLELLGRLDDLQPDVP
jgi:hypothetical protein